MKKSIYTSATSFFLSLVTILSCLCFSVSAAADASVVTQPTRTSFYEGIDWNYARDGSIAIVKGSIDISGTVLSYNSKTYTYKTGNMGANMYAKPVTNWQVGTNEIKIYCDDFSSASYAVTTVNFIRASSIKITSLPDKTDLIMGTDWNMGIHNDVEMTRFDLTGTEISVTYTDSAVKKVSYASNKLIGWSVDPDIDEYYPGENTIYITFCGKTAPFTVNFLTENPYKKGDVNKDGKITSYDALLILQHSTGVITLTSSQIALADIDKNGSVNSSDALSVLQYVVGLKTSL